MLEILWIFIRDTNDREKKVLDFHQPEQLMNIMDFSLPDHPQNLEQILADCSATLRHQVKTGKFTFRQFMKPLVLIFIIYHAYVVK